MPLEALRRQVFIVFETIAMTTFLIMLVASLLQVLFRYVLNLPLMWTEELARLMAVLTTYFGSVIVLMAREHIRVDIVDQLAGPRMRAIVDLICDLLIVTFLGVFAYGCWLMAQATWQTETATMAFFRTGYLYTAVGVAAVAMLCVAIVDAAARFLIAFRQPGETP